MAWKNGGGTTYEIVVAPPGAAFDTFDWRVSIAHIETSGPFSMFADIDRSIAVMSGDGMMLRATDREPAMLDAGSPPWNFRGEWAVDCQLTNGATVDFNVMSRRARFAHRLTRITFTGATRIDRCASITGICLSAGHGIELTTDAPTRARVGLHDFAVLDANDGQHVELTTEGAAAILLVELTPQP
jgi:environmental stress-induced protein Ves